ncbi:MAG TPA: hypothetical protein PKI92_01560 [Candidatus Woesebacteria bacterium]|nr:hypothetical protein [Candidatus Woesebacteria bacterium]HOY60878.1 hypothetical protein [Candidatus Woesebacteria bacterium]HPR99315.1 hypothetical protein [Candidatus Woesebacteria bacterium]
MIILKEIQKNPLDYVILAIILIFAFIAFLFFNQNFDSHNQRRVVYVTAALYLLWSLLHHYHRGDLQASIIIEYLLLAIFAVIIALTTLV